MKISFNDFKEDPPELIQKQKNAIVDVMKSGNYILGSKVAEFESLWADYCGATGCVGVASGLDALELILRARHIGQGDEVITTSMTAFATVLAILKVGAIPVFSDIRTGDCLLDSSSVTRMITKRTRAIILVHLYGRINRMQEWVELSERFKIDLIEDCAQAHGAEEKGRKAGTWGIAAAFSFYPTKNLGCFGDGGAVISSNETIIQHIKRLRNYGQESKYVHDEVGLNSRLDEIQAAILIERLQFLDQMNLKRRAIANLYRQYFTVKQVEKVEQLDIEDQLLSNVHHLFVVRVDNPNHFIIKAQSEGIPLLIHYPKPCHIQKALLNTQFLQDRLCNTESHAAKAISLPCHPNLHEEQVMRICEVITAISISS